MRWEWRGRWGTHWTRPTAPTASPGGGAAPPVTSGLPTGRLGLEEDSGNLLTLAYHGDLFEFFGLWSMKNVSRLNNILTFCCTISISIESSDVLTFWYILKCYDSKLRRNMENFNVQYRNIWTRIGFKVEREPVKLNQLMEIQFQLALSI